MKAYSALVVLALASALGGTPHKAQKVRRRGRIR